MTKFLKKHDLFFWMFILLIGVLYLFCSPTTVQTGDTGELVTNSLNLRVSHPPGYPLWTLLYHLPLRYITISTPFHIASLITIFISLISIGLLTFHYRNHVSLGVLAVLATNGIFWRYSVLPDVFALHFFFLILIFLVFETPSLIDKWWYIFLLSLGVAHHHTIIFAFPMYLLAICQQFTTKKLILSLLFGIISLSIYLLLPFFHPESLGSWGNIFTVQDVFHHFLRKDYGTFSLHARGNNDNSWIFFTSRILLANFWSYFLAIFFIILKFKMLLQTQLKKISMIMFCLLSYFLVFLLSGVMSMDKFGEAVFERFLIQAFFFITAILLLAVNISGVKLPRWIFLCFVINTGVNFLQNIGVNNYYKNTYVEDYMLNNLKSLPENSVFYSSGDTYAFSTYYLRDALRVRPDIKFFTSSLSFSWGPEKIKKAYPDVFSKKSSSLFESIDFEKYTFFSSNKLSYERSDLQWTYYGLLFKLQKNVKSKEPLTFDCGVSSKYVWRHRPKLEDFQKVEFSLLYDLNYGGCYFTSGLFKMSKKDYKEAAIDFERALSLSPFSIKIQERLCETYKKLMSPRRSVCESRLEEMMLSSDPQYFK